MAFLRLGLSPLFINSTHLQDCWKGRKLDPRLAQRKLLGNRLLLLGEICQKETSGTHLLRLKHQIEELDMGGQWEREPLLQPLCNGERR